LARDHTAKKAGLLHIHFVQLPRFLLQDALNQ